MQACCVQEETSTAAIDIPSDAEDSRLVIDDMTAYNRVFKPKRAIARSPNRLLVGSSGTRAPPPPPPLQTNATVRPPQNLFPAPSSEGEEEESGPFCPPPQLQPSIGEPLSIGRLASFLSNVCIYVMQCTLSFTAFCDFLKGGFQVKSDKGQATKTVFLLNYLLLHLHIHSDGS